MKIEQEKIQELLNSGLAENIELAFSLMESTGINLPLPTKKDYAEWLLSMERIHSLEGLEPLIDDLPFSLEKAKQVILKMAEKNFLFLTMDDLDDFPNFIQWLSAVKVLYISSQQHKEIALPQWLKNHAHLKMISFSGNLLLQEDTWQEIKYLPELLFENLPYLKAFPSDGTTWEKLKELTVELFEEASNPDIIKQINFDLLPNLNYLKWNVSVESADSLQITKPSDLETLIISTLDLSHIAHIFAFLPKLKHLEIHIPVAENIPADIFKLKALQSFTLLQYSKNDADTVLEIPANIADLANLEMLKIQGTGMDKLPENFYKLKNLRSLSLKGNSFLVELPEVIAQLNNLEELYLDGTEICEIPDWIGQLTKLKTILCPEVLDSLPEEILSLTKLEKLGIVENIRTQPHIAKILAQFPNTVDFYAEDDLPF